MHWHVLGHLEERGPRPIAEPVPLVDFSIAELMDLEVLECRALRIWWQWKNSCQQWCWIPGACTTGGFCDGGDEIVTKV